MRNLAGTDFSDSQMAYYEKRLLMDDWENLPAACGFDAIRVSSGEFDPRFNGKTITKISRELHMPAASAVAEVLKIAGARTEMVYNCIAEDDLRTFLRDTGCMIGSDAYARKLSGYTAAGKPHPRNYGTFPRFLYKYVLEERLMDLPEGIRRITSLPARTFHLPKRGLIQKHYKADITVFDPSEIRDTATYDNPCQAPKGIKYVILGGRLAVKDEEYTGEKAGKVLSFRGGHS